jgi:hypothetical protein
LDITTYGLGILQLMMSEKDLEKIMAFFRHLLKHCPKLVQNCYWAGTSAIAIEELQHRRSFDIDLHTKTALCDVRPFLRELELAFPGKIQMIQAPGTVGEGFRVSVQMDNGEQITLEVLANYEDIEDDDLVQSKLISEISRVSLFKYLADKIQCLVERHEARDLIDIYALLMAYPNLEQSAKKLVDNLDPLLLVERLNDWDENSIKEDLSSYPDVDFRNALKMMNTILEWVKP